MSRTAKIRIASEEGGEWVEVEIHSLEMPDGAQWDAINGWRKHSLIPRERVDEMGAVPVDLDYEALLRKYMRHVVEEEGIAFIADWAPSGAFTQAEWQCLQRLRDELYEDTP